ncbi:MAG: bifunctional phosphopantothenoylcysteine decarboxylase/phosphopantothenate--cysteine ligase CoaBC [Candidatus Promineifilaceae bacterium]
MTISILDGKRIVLGVTGSIACYKSADLASKLTQAGALVDVVLTQSAQRFITPLTFQAVTGRAVYTDLWDEQGHVNHVRLGESADLLVISPATANTLAKLASGIADNMLTVTALTARCPVLVAPAMDGGMYANAAVCANVQTLTERGVTVIDPKEGRMASGLVGKGRLPETAEMLGQIRLALGRQGALAGKRLLVTAGPTQEPFDPVRYITNHSTGKQGIAIAQAALDMGADVTLITGQIHQPIPFGLRQIKIQTAVELHDAVLFEVGNHDILVMTAAVGDFRPKTTAQHKIKKDPNANDAPAVELTRNPDILKAVKLWREKSADPLFVVGFAAETQDILRNGQSKLIRKGMDMIAVNDVGGTRTGFGVDTNQITLIHRDTSQQIIPLQSKERVAETILLAVTENLT